MLIKSSQWQTLSPILHSFWKESEKNNMDPLDGDKWLREAVIEPKREKWWTPKIIDEDCRTFKLIGRHFFLIKNKADRRNKRFIKISIARYINIITKHTTQITTINVLGQNWSVKRGGQTTSYKCKSNGRKVWKKKMHNGIRDRY